MISSYLLLEHIKALITVWGIVLLSGFSTSAFLRLRLGIPGYVLLGIVYWTISLYVFCFDRGLDVALGLALIMFLVTAVRSRELQRWRSWRPTYFRASGILALG